MLVLTVIAAAAALTVAWCSGFLVGNRPPRALPPATPRAIARVRRHNRADIREALARHGVELRELPVPAEPQIIPLPVDNFETDHEETH
jgi:hypothetical protein